MTTTKVISLGTIKLSQAPRRIHRIKGDGNCFFRAISYIISGSEENHIKIRESIINHMHIKSSELEAYLNTGIDQYLD
jgi:hypothetical protein